MKTNTSKSLIYLGRIYYPELLQLNKVYKPIKKRQMELPGSPVVKIPHFHCPELQVQSLVEELRSHKLHSTAKKKKKKRRQRTWMDIDIQMTNKHMKWCYH